MTLYCIPGLGTDERIFSRLFPLLTGCQTVVLNHIEPTHYKEPLSEYAHRLAAQIPLAAQDPIFLLGYSLGGPIAIEIAKKYKKATVILISTIKQSKEIPTIFKIARVLPLHRYVPIWYTRNVTPRLAPFIGINNKESRMILNAMFQTLPASHFSWGRQAIVDWENEDLSFNYCHINGDNDHIFNNALPYVDHCIKGGTHNMIMDRAEEIAALISPILNSAQE